MKPCHKTTVLQFMLEGPRPCTILCFNVYTTVENLNRNVSIGQLLQHISKSIVVCARSGLKLPTQTYNKFVRLYNHCFYQLCLDGIFVPPKIIFAMLRKFDTTF